jgi:hypothetical protein
MIASATTYIVAYDEVLEVFQKELLFPVWLIYPLAVAQYSAVLMLITKFNRTLTEWAYAGLTFNMLLALGSHAAKQDAQVYQVLIGLLLVLVSYFSWRRLIKVREERQ